MNRILRLDSEGNDNTPMCEIADGIILNDGCGGCVLKNGCPGYYDGCFEAVNSAEGERPPSEAGWISVWDRLPAEGERVLVACEDGIVRLNRIEYGKFPTIMNGQHMFVKTTHWMPLPEPPKDKY